MAPCPVKPNIRSISSSGRILVLLAKEPKAIWIAGKLTGNLSSFSKSFILPISQSRLARASSVSAFDIHGIFHKFVKGSYYCGRHVQSFNYLLQKAQGSVVHLNIPVPEESVQFILSTASSLPSHSLQGHIIYMGNMSLVLSLIIMQCISVINDK